ncbi:MAG: SEC-C domain-containing protein [Planctomycetaceae bacterium]|nr:SEC-C domain-containing protein [Planctomycetaceae bacterium]
MKSKLALSVAGQIFVPITRPIRNPGGKRGRNEPCYCGSGKKWKKCCWRKTK